jgi:transposase
MVTDQQVRRLWMLINSEKTQAIAAAKAGMDTKTARKYIKSGNLPSQCKIRHTWRTREDPFRDSWLEIRDMLSANPGLEAKTVFEYIKTKYPGAYDDGQLRTLQRRVKRWRAQEGPPKEVFFPQEHYPGQLCASDFTHMSNLGVTIRGEVFKHLLYHFTLTYSNWETGSICFSESFESLSCGFQNAIWQLGGVPLRHRLDRMSAAVNKDCNPEAFTRAYQALMRHYAIEPQRTNAASANENGDIEQRHYRLKKAIEQALILRGSRNFLNQDEYSQFLKMLFKQLNSGRQIRLQEELAVLRTLPYQRLDDCKIIEKTVGPSSTIYVRNNTYSVDSRLIGENIRVKLYLDYIEVWHGQQMVERIPRLRGEGHHRIEYRHIIDWLIRKPGAFENYRYKSDMFPSSVFRLAYDKLRQQAPLQANKEYLKILYTAAKEGESSVEHGLRQVFLENRPMSSAEVGRYIEQSRDIPLSADVSVEIPALEAYDELLEVAHG